MPGTASATPGAASLSVPALSVPAGSAAGEQAYYWVSQGGTQTITAPTSIVAPTTSSSPCR